jgi:hypothetical protein
MRPVSHGSRYLSDPFGNLVEQVDCVFARQHLANEMTRYNVGGFGIERVRLVVRGVANSSNGLQPSCRCRVCRNDCYARQPAVTLIGEQVESHDSGGE